MDATIIIGGGLSGLATARRLVRAGREVVVLEARERTGGRILSPGGFDMGPAWIWPGQARVAALLDELGLATFPQHWNGAPLFEDARGQVRRGGDTMSMRGALRVAGGLAALTDALAADLPEGVVRLGAPATEVAREGDAVTVRTPEGTYRGARAILAVPPRLAATLAFVPPLPEPAMAAMRAVPTWMAGHAKALAVYRHPFWRAEGLSGDAGSQLGPMVEIHDASPGGAGPDDGRAGALFGFFGVPAAARADRAALRAATLAQLGRLFGPQAAAPVRLTVVDWARAPFTATALDTGPPEPHPRYGLPPALASLWDGRLLLGSTEVAPGAGGLVEGALEAAEAVTARL